MTSIRVMALACAGLASFVSIPDVQAAPAGEGDWNRVHSWLYTAGPDDAGIYKAWIQTDDLADVADTGDTRIEARKRQAVRWLCSRMIRDGSTLFSIAPSPSECGTQVWQGMNGDSQKSRSVIIEAAGF